MKTVIEMAEEAGCSSFVHECTVAHVSDLERFAELVRVAEREKYKWDIHSCGPTCDKAACVATRKAVAAEREACAKFVENYDVDIAEAVRARGNT